MNGAKSLLQKISGQVEAHNKLEDEFLKLISDIDPKVDPTSLKTELREKIITNNDTLKEISFTDSKTQPDIRKTIGKL